MISTARSISITTVFTTTRMMWPCWAKLTWEQPSRSVSTGERFWAIRAAALTGVGLSTNQFPTDFSNLTEAAEIRSNGSLILHGGYAGIELLY